jgi:predicted small lipoprotein YifL
VGNERSNATLFLMVSNFKMKILNRIASLVATSALVILVAGCGKKGYSELAERPAEQAAPPPSTATASVITLNAMFPYDMLSKTLTDSLPAEIPLKGRERVCMNVEQQVQKTVEEKIGGDVGKLIGGVVRIVTKVVTIGQVENLCLDVDYQASIKRDGNVVVSQIPNGVRMSVPVRIDGDAGFVGALANFLKLNKKNFRGALTAQADVALGVSENWCPTVNATTDFSWRDKAQLEVAGKFWINVDNQAGPEIKKAMSDAVAKIPNLLTCDRIKELVLPIWHVYNVALPVIAGQTGRVIVTPQRVGFSGLTYTPTGAQFAMMLIAKTEVELGTTSRTSNVSNSTTLDSNTLPVSMLPLPKLETIPPAQNTLNLSVPIAAPYESLNQLMSNAVVGRTFDGKTEAVSASVTIRETKVYPSGERIVVGVRFESKISKPKSLAPQGWIYLVAKPAFDPATQMLSVADVDFSRIIDNDAWNVLSFLFQDQIRTAVQDAVRVDLRPAINAARTTINKQLATAAAKEGINVGLKEDFVGLSKVTVTSRGLQVAVALQGTANITVLNRPSR